MARTVHEARITKESAALKRLRDQTKITVREVAQKTGRSVTLIAHLESGWNPIRDHHLEWLLPVYGVSKFQFDLMLKGESLSPKMMRQRATDLLLCLDDKCLILATELLAALCSANREMVQS